MNEKDFQKRLDILEQQTRFHLKRLDKENKELFKKVKKIEDKQKDLDKE